MVSDNCTLVKFAYFVHISVLISVQNTWFLLQNTWFLHFSSLEVDFFNFFTFLHFRRVKNFSVPVSTSYDNFLSIWLMPWNVHQKVNWPIERGYVVAVFLLKTNSNTLYNLVILVRKSATFYFWFLHTKMPFYYNICLYFMHLECSGGWKPCEIATNHC